MSGPQSRELLAAHANELERMPALVAAGVLEISWRDADGAHFEQGDLDLRHRPPQELSLRLSKLGETLFLAGSNGTQWWWFEGWSKPTRLLAGRRDGAASDPRVPITMEEMLTLLGLRAFDPRGIDAAPLRDDAGRWIVPLEADRSPLRVPTRLTFDRAQVQGDTGWSLVGIDAIDETGQVILRSSLERHRRIERRDRAPGDWPRLATRIRVQIPPRGDRGSSNWLVELDRPSASSERIAPRLFDLDAVKASLRAEVVEERPAESPE